MKKIVFRIKLNYFEFVKMQRTQGSRRQGSRIKIDNNNKFTEPPIVQKNYTQPPPVPQPAFTQPPVPQPTFTQPPILNKNYVEPPKPEQKTYTGYNNIEHTIVKRLWETTKKADLLGRRAKKSTTGNENYRERAMSEKVLHSV